MEVEILKTETLPEAYAKVVTENAIAELQQNYSGLIIKGLEDKVGYEAVDKARKHVKKIRTQIETVRKELKADSLAYGRKVDDIARELTSKIEPLENYLLETQTAVDTEKERLLKEEAEKLQREEQERIDGLRKAEEEKQAKIQARQKALNRTGAIIDEVLLGKTEEDAHEVECYVLGDVLKPSKWLLECEEKDFHAAIREYSIEAEKIKMAKEKESEENRLRMAAVVEAENKQKEERAAFEREKEALAKEKREAEEAKQAEEKQKIEAEDAQHLLAVNKAFAKGEKRAAELAKFGFDITKVESGEENYILELARKSDEHFLILRDDWIKVADDNKKAALERNEALKPDKEKLTQLAKDLAKFQFPKLTSEAGKKIITEAKRNVTETALFINEQIKNLK